MNAFFGRAAGAILSLSLLSAPAAQAQDAYPNKPVKVIVHTLPGASSDVLARAVSKAMGDQLGQSFVVENRSGAGGAIGVDAVAKAAPDGYTLLAGASSAMVMLPIVLTRKLPYDENKDFAPIGVISRSPFLLVASQASGIRDLPDLIAKAKAHPGKITYGSAGPGTNPHLLGELLSQLAGIELTHVPYKGRRAGRPDGRHHRPAVRYSVLGPAACEVGQDRGHRRQQRRPRHGRARRAPEGTGLSLADAVRLDRAVRAGRHAARDAGAAARCAQAGAAHAGGARVHPRRRQRHPDLYGDDMLAMQKQMQDFWRGVVKSRGIRLD